MLASHLGASLCPSCVSASPSLCNVAFPKKRNLKQEISRIPSAPLHTKPILPQHLLPKRCMCCHWWPYSATSLAPKDYIYIRVHSWGCSFCWFVNCIMTCVPLMDFWVPYLHSLVPFTVNNLWSLSSLRSVAFSRMSCSWNHTVCRLLKLASFAYEFKCLS